jgi:hypothetical protein
VSIEKRENGGKILIDFFSNDDLREILLLLETNKAKSPTERLDKHIAENPIPPKNEFIPNYVRDPDLADLTIENLNSLDDRTPEQKSQDENSEEEIYSIKNFSV